MSFLYFAYGSNLWPPHLVGRCPTARHVGAGVVKGWAAVYDKPGSDGTAKMNLRRLSGAETLGVVYRLDDDDRPALDAAEPGYRAFEVEVAMGGGQPVTALTYVWEAAGTDAAPSVWYVDTVVTGAKHHGLDNSYIARALVVPAVPDATAPGLRPADHDDLPEMQRILAACLKQDSGRYTIHPGDLAWWMWHDDPRYPHHDSYWVRRGEAVLVIEARRREISAFAVPGMPVIPIIEWAQRKMGGVGEVGWVADSDDELVAYVSDTGYEPVHTDRLYHWDLSRVEVPVPELPQGWELRPVDGEAEADTRRSASHAAFRSTMEGGMHLERYLRFMRSPVYDSDRDLVAVAPDGRVASFMVWWPDPSGIAQIEPFGTHPDFHRQGIGRALIYYGLNRMREAGMKLTRVITDEPRSDATSFYEGVGFADVGRVRWWRRA